MNTILFSRKLSLPNLALALAGVGLAVCLPAQEQLTLATVSAWQATGTGPMTEPGTGVIILPAGSQLARTYADNRVAVHLLTRPYFYAEAGGWPALEVGPGALTFVRDGSGGGLVLLGDNFLTLPQSIALGADGRSLHQLDLNLSYDRTQQESTLVLDGATYHVAAMPLGKNVTVALSAGDETDWTLDRMEVTTAASLVTPNVATGKTALADKPADTGTLNPAADAATRKRAFEDALSFFKAKAYEQAEERLFSANRQKPTTLGWYAESAGKLTQIALVLRQQYDPRGAIAVSQRAQDLLDLGEKLVAKTDKQKQHADLFAMKAYLAEELLRDSASARDAYDRAKQADPTSVRADQGLKHLDAVQAKAERWGSKN